MSTNTIIGIVAAILIIGGGAWYMSSNTGTTVEQAETSQNEEKGSGTFGALLAMGGSRTCTMSVANAEMTANGTVYISGDKVRGDFTTSSNGQSYTGHMLQLDGYAYSWSDAMPQGVKMRITDTQTSSGSSQSIDPNAEVTYDCDMGVSDESVFVVPSTVTFMELGAGGGIPAGMMPR